MGVTELNKYSVVKISTDKWRLDGFRPTEDRTTDLNLGEPRKRILWVVMGSACVYKHKTERIRYLGLCSATFWFIYDFTDIDECKGNHSCHLNATCTNNLGSHVCECHPGYIGNGRNCTGEFNFLATCILSLEQSYMTRSTTAPHHSGALQEN